MVGPFENALSAYRAIVDFFISRCVGWTPERPRAKDRPRSRIEGFRASVEEADAPSSAANELGTSHGLRRYHRSPSFSSGVLSVSKDRRRAALSSRRRKVLHMEVEEGVYAVREDMFRLITGFHDRKV